MPELVAASSKAEGRVSPPGANMPLAASAAALQLPTSDDEDALPPWIEAPRHLFEEMCAELDARPPSPLRPDELPRKQRNLIRIFEKHGLEPPCCRSIRSKRITYW